MTTSLPPESSEDRIATVPAAVRAAAAHVQNAPPADPPRTPRMLQGLADAPPIRPRRVRPSRRGKWIRRAILMTLVTATGFALAVYHQPLTEKVHALISPHETNGLDNIQTYTARRGELRITLVEEGKL